MAVAIFPVVLVFGGALVYAASNNAKVAEIGRVAYACGLLVLAFTLASRTLHF